MNPAAVDADAHTPVDATPTGVLGTAVCASLIERERLRIDDIRGIRRIGRAGRRGSGEEVLDIVLDNGNPFISVVVGHCAEGVRLRRANDREATGCRKGFDGSAKEIQFTLRFLAVFDAVMVRKCVVAKDKVSHLP
jgi:hypothetical protein